MTFSNEQLLLAVVFAAVFLLIEGIYYLVQDMRGTDSAANRRLKMLAGANNAELVLHRLRRGGIGAHSGGIAGRLPILSDFDRIVTQAGLIIPTGRLVGWGAALGVMLFVVNRLFSLVVVQPLLEIVVALGIGLAIPPLVVLFLRRRRVKRFAEQLPDTLDLIVRALRAGHPVSSALSLAAREMRDPIGTEFGIVADEVTYGMDLRESLSNLAQRMPLPDLHYVVVAINVQYGTGGNLAEVLDGLSRIIRARFLMFRKVVALSAEGRVSAMILTVIPFAVVGAVLVLSPAYFFDVRDDSKFMPLTITAVIMLVSGLIAMWRMIRIKV